jgi:hypothetical protein
MRVTDKCPLILALSLSAAPAMAMEIGRASCRERVYEVV